MGKEQQFEICYIMYNTSSKFLIKCYKCFIDFYNGYRMNTMRKVIVYQIANMDDIYRSVRLSSRKGWGKRDIVILASYKFHFNKVHDNLV